MKAAYLKAPYQYEIRDVELREIKDDEVIVDVKACGFCGHDNILAKYHATEWEPFGHEFSGIVKKVGKLVTNVKVGDHVCIETATFDPLIECSRNGRVDFDNTPCGPSFMELDKGHRQAMGFAEETIVPAALCVKFDGMSFAEAAIMEPMGVAYDMYMTADVRLNNDVLVFGCGPIGLMALQMAKRGGARKVYAALHSDSTARMELAKKFGADEIICTDKTPLTEYKFEKGGVDRILLSTPPTTIGEACEVLNTGGIISFIGISYNDTKVTFDSNTVHLNKLQIRASNAIPALYFPMCIDMVKAGMVDVKSLITHTFDLPDLPKGLEEYRNDRSGAVKAVMVRE